MSVVPSVFVAPTMMRRISGTSTTQLIIAGRLGYRHRLLDLFVTGEVAGNTYTVQVGTRTVMQIPGFQANSIFMSTPQNKIRGRGLLWGLAKILGEENLPNAAQDEDITITASSAVTRLDAYFQEQKTDDVSSHAVAGGSDSPKKIHFEVLDQKLTAVGTGQNVLTENMPTGLQLLDGNGRVKATQKFTVYMLAADYISSGVNFTRYSRLHIFDEDTELFTPLNHEGILIDETIPANDLRFNWNLELWYQLDTPYLFDSEHQLSVLADVPAAGVTGTGSTLRTVMIGLLERVVK